MPSWFIPRWLLLILRWGGVALAVVSAVAIIYVEQLARIPEALAAPSAAPLTLYWVLLVIGAAAAIVGFAVGKPKTG